MSFGRPPSFDSFKVLPPDRGSFPLDHEGECKQAMMEYLKCLKSSSSQSGNCRNLSKEYLNCRMSKGLMERDEWKNLGFAAEAAQLRDSTTPQDTQKPTTVAKTPSNP